MVWGGFKIGKSIKINRITTQHFPNSNGNNLTALYGIDVIAKFVTES